MQSNTTTTKKFDAVIVGGGPAGAVLALLLARQGLEVMLLEAHRDFDRDFRGDTVHPSTLDLLEQLGLLERLLQLPHVKLSDFPTHFPDGSVSPPGKPLSHARHPFSYQVPQARFIEMLVQEARRYPSFHLTMGARVERLIEADGTVTGVRFRDGSGVHDLNATLVVGADGRFSKVRQLAGLQLIGSAEAMDVLWLRLPYAADDPQRAHGVYLGADGQLVVLRRDDGWQIGYILPKGSYQRLREAGVEALRQAIARQAPWLANRTVLVRDWGDTSLLVVEAGRVEQWHRPGLLLIGDAAHVMSPVFGVGINYAIQDAVVAANALGPRLRGRGVTSADLECVQRRRELPTRLMQALQRQARPRFAPSGKPVTPPRWLRLIFDMPLVADLRGRLVAYGGWAPERVRQPAMDYSSNAPLLSVSPRAAANASSRVSWLPSASAAAHACSSSAECIAARVR